MASDRSPLSKRLKSLAQRAGLPVDDPAPAERAATAAVPPAAPPPSAAVPPPEPDADEQPTGDIPAIGEQPTDDQPALRIADEQPTVVSDALNHGDAAPPTTGPDPFAQEDRPPLAPPVVPARPADEPQPEPAPQAGAADEHDDEPFSPRSTIWPQSAPTPRFERPAAHSTADPTFPAPSPAPVDEDPSAVEPSPAPAPAADLQAPAPAAPAPEVTLAQGDRAVEVPPTDDPEVDQPAVDGAPAPGKTGRLGALRRLRGGRAAAAEPAPTPASTLTPVDDPPTEPAPSASAPAEPAAPTPEPAAPNEAPSPAEAPASYEPPAKPSFAERAALRRRAKTLRARRDAGLLELGAIVLDQRRFGDPTGGTLTRRRTDELADIDGELAAIEQVLDDDGPAETVAQLGVVRCLSCTALVGPRDRFCVQCGAPRPEGDVRPAGAA